MKTTGIVILAILAMCISSCVKDSVTTTVSGKKIGRSIPNWATDTLVGALTHAPFADTLYTYSSAGHSYIKYHGTTYEIWDERYVGDTWDGNAQSYADGNVGYIMNDTTALTACIANPRTYVDQNTGQTMTQAQSLTVLIASPFDSVTNGLYKHLN